MNELAQLSREELVERLQKLGTHCQILTQVLTSVIRPGSTVVIPVNELEANTVQSPGIAVRTVEERGQKLLVVQAPVVPAPEDLNPKLKGMIQ